MSSNQQKGSGKFNQVMSSKFGAVVLFLFGLARSSACSEGMSESGLSQKVAPRLANVCVAVPSASGARRKIKSRLDHSSSTVYDSRYGMLRQLFSAVVQVGDDAADNFEAAEPKPSH